MVKAGNDAYFSTIIRKLSYEWIMPDKLLLSEFWNFLSQWSGSSSVTFWGFIVAEFAELVLGIFAGKDKGLDVLDTLL